MLSGCTPTSIRISASLKLTVQTRSKGSGAGNLSASKHDLVCACLLADKLPAPEPLDLVWTVSFRLALIRIDVGVQPDSMITLSRFQRFRILRARSFRELKQSGEASAAGTQFA